MPRTNTVIIGGGQAGLALSHCLSALAIDHVVMERGKLAQRWRSQSWDSLHLLTPNWMTRLPGFHYDGDDADGFMSVRELIALFERYAATFRPPLLTETSVQSVDARTTGYRVATSRGTWVADSVVVATGSCDLPFVPDVSRGLASSITQIVPAEYRRPDQLPAGGVLVVGASSTGVQLADEIQRSGRQVTLAVGRHTRLPRQYRGDHSLFVLSFRTAARDCRRSSETISRGACRPDFNNRTEHSFRQSPGHRAGIAWWRHCIPFSQDRFVQESLLKMIFL